MSPYLFREYIQSVRERYLRSSKAEKELILNEAVHLCRKHRKSIIRAINRPPRAPKARVGRPRRYTDPLVLSVLVALWKGADMICGKRLHGIIPLWLPHYEHKHGELPEAVRHHVLAMSPATIDRRLSRVRRAAGRAGRTGTKPGSLLKTQIPIQTAQWNEHRVGFLEADTVAHCGGSMAGTFVWTLDCVDIASGWIIQRAVWGKGEHNVYLAIKDIERTLPFKLLGFDSDNGGEFINSTLLHYFLKRPKPVCFTRAREYQSNDNAHVEGKNWTHVRQQFGYKRFDNPEIIDLLNDFYQSEWYLYANFFLPSMKLIRKDRIASRIVRVHDAPQPPATRLLNADHVAKTTKTWIKTIYRTTNPFELRAAIDRKRNAILKLASSHLAAPKSLSLR